MTPLSTLRETYLTAALAGRRREALQVIHLGLDQGHGPQALLRQVVHAAQHEVGVLWETNEIGVHEEHMATVVAQVAASVLFDRTEPAPPNGFSVVLACVYGERHGFPAQLAADAFELAGFSVRFVGSDTPRSALVALLHDDTPDVVGLSASLLHHRGALLETLAAVRRAAPDTVRLAGGRAASAELRAVDPGVIVATGAAEDVVDTVLSRLRDPLREVAR